MWGARGRELPDTLHQLLRFPVSTPGWSALCHTRHRSLTLGQARDRGLCFGSNGAKGAVRTGLGVELLVISTERRHTVEWRPARVAGLPCPLPLMRRAVGRLWLWPAFYFCCSVWPCFCHFGVSGLCIGTTRRTMRCEVVARGFFVVCSALRAMFLHIPSFSLFLVVLTAG